MCNVKRNDASGFTLVEILLALFILGIGIVFSFNLFLTALQSFSYSRQVNQTAKFAEHKLEELKSRGEVLPLGQSSGTYNGLTWDLAVEPLALAEGIAVKFVRLEVTFTYQSRLEKNLFSTYLY